MSAQPMIYFNVDVVRMIWLIFCQNIQITISFETCVYAAAWMSLQICWCKTTWDTWCWSMLCERDHWPLYGHNRSKHRCPVPGVCTVSHIDQAAAMPPLLQMKTAPPTTCTPYHQLNAILMSVAFWQCFYPRPLTKKL